jgi:hypothetical protein
MTKVTEHLIHMSILATDFYESMVHQMVDPYNPDEAAQVYERVGPMHDQNGHEFTLSDLFVLRAWRTLGNWNVVKITPELAEAFAQTDPPADGVFDERGHAIAIEVGDLSHVTAYLGRNAEEIVGFTGGMYRPQMDVESHQRLVRNVHYVLSEHRRASSFDGLEVTARVPSAKANKKRGRKYYPGVEFVIGSTTTIYLDDREAQERAGGGREGWTLSTRKQVRGFWRHQAHGPKHSLRKVIFVKPFWRGPVDAPISIHTTNIVGEVRP